MGDGGFSDAGSWDIFEPIDAGPVAHALLVFVKGVVFGVCEASVGAVLADG